MSKASSSAAQRGLLPREGFHADVVGRIMRHTLLNPSLTVAAVLLSRFTDQGRNLGLRFPRGLSWLYTLAALGVARVTNNWLNRRTLNNGVSDTYDWQKEIVLVTGGSDGIGKRIVQMLSERPEHVKVVVLDVQPLTWDPPPNVFFFRCDISSTENIASVARDVRSTVGSPTILVNNAGVCKGKPMLSTSDSDLNLTFNVNTIAHYKLAREFLPSIIAANHGMVVTVASSAAWTTAPQMTEYAASKAAALAFHEGLSAELVTHYDAPKVRTVVVNQGYTRTSLFQGFGVREDAFVGPSLHVDTVAEAIVNQILKGESDQLILPGVYRLMVANTRSFPNWMQHNARIYMKGLMKDWTGRQVEQ